MTDETKSHAADAVADQADQQDTELADQTLDNVAGGANTINPEGGAGGLKRNTNPGGGTGGGNKRRRHQEE